MLVATVSAVHFLTACVDFQPTCPFSSRCEGRRMHLCTNADEQYQHYQERYVDCGAGKTCAEPLECVLSPLQPCAGSACDGDTRDVCGASGYRTGTTEDCTKAGRICRASASDAACVLPDAPCQGNKPTSCSADQTTYYTGCDKGFGYAVDGFRCSECADATCTPGNWVSSHDRVCRESASGAACVLPTAPCPDDKPSFCWNDHREYLSGCEQGFGYPLESQSCWVGCGSPVCVDDNGSAACADSPPIACGDREDICSQDGRRSLRCKPGQAYYTCATDCTVYGQTCVAATGLCGN
jgi:hypothetical protein